MVIQFVVETLTRTVVPTEQDANIIILRFRYHNRSYFSDIKFWQIQKFCSIDCNYSCVMINPWSENFLGIWIIVGFHHRRVSRNVVFWVYQVVHLSHYALLDPIVFSYPMRWLSGRKSDERWFRNFFWLIQDSANKVLSHPIDRICFFSLKSDSCHRWKPATSDKCNGMFVFAPITCSPECCVDVSLLR